MPALVRAQRIIRFLKDSKPSSLKGGGDFLFVQNVILKL
jgi:hypothetical protein